MDTAFDAQFRVIQEAFAREGTRLAVHYTPAGEVDYVYEADRVLVSRRDDAVTRVATSLRNARVADEHPNFVTLAVDDDGDGYRSVPDLLADLDPDLNVRLEPGALPLVAPNHLLHVSRLCSAIEPEVVPPGTLPHPAPRPPQEGAATVRVGLVDNGIIKPVDPFLTWLAGVDGDEDPVGPVLPDGRRLIQPFTAHGTCVAGVLRCIAPQTDVRVGDEMDTSGATLESKIVERLERLVTEFAPSVVNISSGTYCRNDWAPVGFEGFLAAHPDIQVVAAAGNDRTDRPVYPAAYPDVISVGALGPDQTHRAWFSNFGPTVDVYVLGEGIVNAFTTGQYRYQEPPKRPARQDFTVPLARWDGTSFAAPIVSGLIAARMGTTGESAKDAAAAVLAEAAAGALPGVGPVLTV